LYTASMHDSQDQNRQWNTPPVGDFLLGLCKKYQ
jgi:hypothetical protein